MNVFYSKFIYSNIRFIQRIRYKHDYMFDKKFLIYQYENYKNKYKVKFSFEHENGKSNFIFHHHRYIMMLVFHLITKKMFKFNFLILNRFVQ